MANLHLALITNIPDQQLITFRFNERGGSVGRSQDCDWRLNDAERFISNKHIIISFVNDHFLVTDTSSNGTYINDNSQPLGKGNSHRLQLNDIIKLGTLYLQVNAIDLSPAHVPAPPVPAAAFAPNNISATDSDLLDLVSGKHTSANSASASHAAPLNSSLTSAAPPQASSGKADNSGLFDILSAGISGSSPTGMTAPPGAGEANTPARPQASVAPAASPFLPQHNDNTIPDNWDLDDEPAQMLTPPATSRDVADHAGPLSSPAASANKIPEYPHYAATPAAAEPTLQPASHSVVDVQAVDVQALHAKAAVQQATAGNKQDDFFTLLYQKLGLPAAYMQSLDKAEFANDLMQVLMTSTQGLMALLAGRSVLKQESRLSMTMIKPQSNNPIKFSLDPSDTLEMLLVKKKPGYLTAQAAYAEAMHDLQLHQMAFLSGLQASLQGILDELSPGNIEQEANEKGRGLMDFKGHARNWETFANKQQTLQKQVKENLNDILSRHFSAAYESYISNAKTNRQGD